MIHYFHSDDPGAPVLAGPAGYLLNVLDACLVNGYGDQAPAGWAKAYEGTNKAAYRAPAGNRFYLRVDDTTIYSAKVVGYRQMTDVDTGVGPFPTAAQYATGLYVYKSTGSDASARAWLLAASDRAFLLWYGFGYFNHAGVGTSCDSLFFGDCPSYLPNDPSLTLLVGRTSSSSSTSYTHFANRMTSSGVSTGHYLASDYAQSGNAIQCGILSGKPWSSSTGGTIGPPFPDPITGGLLLDRMRIMELGGSVYLVRGHLPGVFNPLHYYPGTHLDRIQGRGVLAGRELILVQTGGANGRFALSLHEDDWLLAA